MISAVLPDDSDLFDVKLVEVKHHKRGREFFWATHIVSKRTLRIFLPRPGEIKISPIAALADAANENGEGSLPGATLAQKIALIELILTAMRGPRNSVRCNGDLITKLASMVDLRFSPRISKEERARKSIPAVDYEISLLEDQESRIQSKLNRARTKLANLKRDAGEEK